MRSSSRFFEAYGTWIVSISCLLVAALVNYGLHQPASSPSVETVHARTLGGETFNPFASRSNLTVLVFVATECPNSNRLTPEIRRLHETYSPKGVQFWLVYPDTSVTANSVRRHLEEYACKLPVLIDSNHHLVKIANARVTPESALFDSEHRLIYHGAINNQFVELGKARPEPTAHHLEAALLAVLAGNAVVEAHVNAVGCYIPPLE
jgi:hypothetical protein